LILYLSKVHRLRVFKNRLLRRYLDLGDRKSEKDTEYYKILEHSQFIHYTSPNITKVVKMRRVRYFEHIACMETMRNQNSSLGGNLVGETYKQAR
jgi:hypothetical protein